MAVGTLAPQTVSAYKYYIHTGNGNVITVKADNSNTAIDLFNLLIERGFGCRKGIPYKTTEWGLYCWL